MGMSNELSMKDTASQIQPEQIEQAVLLIRGQRVMLDRDLASLYGVETKNLNKAVQRNLDRFPKDFMFQLTVDDLDGLSFQFGSLKRGAWFPQPGRAKDNSPAIHRWVVGERGTSPVRDERRCA
jgi:hypothetical protein